MISHCLYTIGPCLHFPLIYRAVKQMERNSQSTVMATQTPNTPQPSRFPRTKEHPIRKIHMEAMDQNIVKCTSPAARSIYGNENDKGQIAMVQKV